jgi:hypothetical protein
MPKYRIYALCFLVLLLAACTGGSPTEIVLPTVAAFPTDNSLPPAIDATRVANEQTSVESNLGDVAINDTVTLVGLFSFDAASGVSTVQTDDGQSVQLILPPPMAESFNGQRVQASGQVTDVENLTVSVQNIAPYAEATLLAEATQDAPSISLPPELTTQTAPTIFSITPNLSALESYDAILESQAEMLEGYQLLSISNEIGVWRISMWQADAQMIYEFVVLPDGTVQSTQHAQEMVVTLVAVDRAQVTVESDDFVVLLRENQLDNPPYTIILSASQQATTWSAIDAQGQPLLTVNAITGDVIP